MLTLIVRQSLKDGTAKTWKLRSTEPTHTFGSSRLADLISVSPAIAGISGIFEYRDNAWWYVDMNFSTGASSAGISALRIDGEKSLALGESTLHLVSVRKEVDLFKRLENMQSTKSTTGKPGKSFQMFMIRQGQQVVETRILPMGKSFKSQILPLKTSIASVPGENWHRQKVGDLEVSQKTISMDDATALGHLSADQLVDKDSKTAVYFTLGATALIAFLAVFSPKNDNNMAAVTLPKMVQKIIVKTEIKPHKKIPPPEAKPAQQVVVKQQSAPAAGPKAEMPTGSHKMASMLKSISGGRISQLLSKVSAQAAKSGNIIISNGVKAGSTNSGRALAAVGSMERSGRDWGNESNGSGVVISTAGKGGGKNAAGMGGLAAGGTGTAGVGLIEEESEITGGLDREIIAQYIKSQLGQILYCYERQLSASPDLFGKVAVKFTIGPAGSVEQHLIGDTTLKNATVEGCILNRVASWKFPAPQGGTRVLVTYPFLFKSTN